jgi:acyl dehydratase
MTIDVDEVAEGPWFEDLYRGQVFAGAPALTLSSGQAAVHQSIVGDRLRLHLDDELARATAGRAPLAHPALVWNVAIGQSTVATHNVKANLFYRGLELLRLPAIGDTLRTSTEVVGLRQNTIRPGRAATGLVALRMTTTDQEGRLVLDFLRCAMVALRDPDGRTDAADDLDTLAAPSVAGLAFADWGWDLAGFRAAGGSDSLEVGRSWTIGGGDIVSSAPELARLTLNIAKVHHDARAGGGHRLVYGGHTIALALAQASRALPDLVTVVRWPSCDHLGPVYEGDTLRSRLTVERWEELPGGAGLAHLRSQVTADETGGERAVLDWRFVAVCA